MSTKPVCLYSKLAFWLIPSPDVAFSDHNDSRTADTLEICQDVPRHLGVTWGLIPIDLKSWGWQSVAHQVHAVYLRAPANAATPHIFQVGLLVFSLDRILFYEDDNQNMCLNWWDPPFWFRSRQWWAVTRKHSEKRCQSWFRLLLNVSWMSSMICKWELDSFGLCLMPRSEHQMGRRTHLKLSPWAVCRYVQHYEAEPVDL